MRKIFLFTTLILSCVLYINSQEWQVYDGSLLPVDAGLESSDKSGDTIIHSITDDPDIIGNKLYDWTLYGSGKQQWRSAYSVAMPTFTAVARIKAQSTDTNAIELRLRNGAWRFTIKIESSEIDPDNVRHDVAFTHDPSDWHIYRMAVKDSIINVYLDESSTPVITDTSNTAVTDRYFRFGDGSSSNPYGSLVDWVVWDTTGAYAPGDVDLPETLTGIGAKEVNWNIYDGSQLPEDAGLESSDKSGDTIIHEIIEDPEIGGNMLYSWKLYGSGKQQWRSAYSVAMPTFTAVARIKAQSADTNAIELRLRNGAWRFTVKIESSEIDPDNVRHDVAYTHDPSDWHIYRMAIKDSIIKVYLDENINPVIVDTSSTAVTDRYFRFGDGSSSNPYGSQVDWVIWDTSGAYAPGQAKMPETLTGLGNDSLFVWKLYSGNVTPDVHDPVFVTSNISGTGSSNNIVADDDHAGNNLLKFVCPVTGERYMWRYNFETTGEKITFVTRVKTASDTLDRALEIDIDCGGFRERLYIKNDNTYQLNESGDKGSLPSTQYFHTFRITKDTSEVKVYLDENPEPIAEVVTPTTGSNNYFRFGDGNGSPTMGALIDYVIWNEHGAYSPLELALPASLLVGDTVSYDNSLASLDVSGGLLVPEFNPDSLEYQLKLEADCTSITVDAMANDINATVTGDGHAAVLPHTFNIVVTAEDGSEREYNVQAYVDTVSHDAALSSLTVSPGTLVPEFSPEITSYILNLIVSDESFTITAATHNNMATIVGDTIVTNYEDDISVVVTAEDGFTIMTYDIAINLIDTADYGYGNWLVYNGSVLPSETGIGENNWDLTSVSQASPGADFVEQVIADTNISGNMLLEYQQPTATYTYMYQYKYDADGYTGTDFTLVARIKAIDNTFDRIFDLQWRHGNVGVRDELRVYPPDNRIKLENSGVDTIFDDGVFDFYAWHIYRVEVAGATATVYVDENPEPLLTATSTSGTSDLYMKFGDGGSATIGGYVDWIVLDTTGAYSPEELALPIFLTGLPQRDSTDASLASLGVNYGVLTPEFAPHILAYSLELPAGSQNVMINAVPTNDLATVIGDGLFSNVPGTATISVTAEDGVTTADYLINVTVGTTPSSDSTLLSLTVSQGTLNPAFDPDVTSYGLHIANTITSVTVTALPNNTNSSVTGAGDITTLPATVTITVTAEDGSAMVYTINITLTSFDADLATLSPNVGTLDPPFDAGTTSYTLEVPVGTSSVIIDATASDDLATVSGAGLVDEIPSTVTITVTAEDGSTQDYIIDVDFATDIENSGISNLEIYPNPVSNYLFIKTSSKDLTVSIYNLIGEQLFEELISGDNYKINMNQFKAGLYIVEISDNNDLQIIQKIIKE